MGVGLGISDDDIKAFQDFIAEEARKEEILESQLKRLHNHVLKHDNFDELIELVTDKYNSDSYVNRWYSRSIEPPEKLFWLLKDYAVKYGREATREEYEKHGNNFTGSLHTIHGYFFNVMNGQGSVVKISK